MADPTYIGSHDWAQFYTEAWGWLPVDCSFGGAGYRKNSPERRAFYLGNIDPWRMAANTHYYAPFQPASQYVRSDPYDSQRGEVETAQRALTSGEIGTRFEMVAYSERKSPEHPHHVCISAAGRDTATSASAAPPPCWNCTRSSWTLIS